MILLLTIDIMKPAEIEYSALHATIKAQGIWWHYLRPTWLISTTKSVQEVADAINPLLRGGKGRALIVELHRPYQGLLPKVAWDWIQKHLDDVKP